MNVHQRNQRTKQALGIASIRFMYFRSGNSHWLVTMASGETFTFAVPNLATESTVLRVCADKLAKLGRAVEYPKGVA